MAGLALREISKSFDSTPVLEDISLELADGELLVLLGSSGCGKSTLLRIIAGLEKADNGEVFISDRRVDQLSPRQRNVALVFQNYSLYPHMTVAKNLAFPLKVARLKQDEINRRVKAVAEMLGLADRLKDRPGQLSGGQRQRVALGRAIIREPSIFLLDEPLSNLDADLRVRMRQEIVALQQRLKKTTVHVTHDQAEALSMADRIALLHDGHIEQLGTPEELYKHPATRYVAEFVGQPRINMIEGQIDNNRSVPFGLKVDAINVPSHGNVSIGIRPEAILLRGDGEYLGTLTSSEYLGEKYVITLDFQGHPLTATDTKAPAPGENGELRFDIDPSGGVMFFDAGTGLALNHQP